MNQLLERVFPTARAGRGLEDLFETLTENRGAIQPEAGFPAINAWEESGDTILEAELPGMSLEEINVLVTGNDVTISGERKAPEPKGETCLRSERSAGAFSRTLALPWEISADKVSAKYADGVLTVRLPKSERSKPKKINVSVA